VLVAASVAATAQPMPAARAADGTLTNAAGMTLYVFDRDVGGKAPATALAPPTGPRCWCSGTPGPQGTGPSSFARMAEDNGFQREAAVHVGEGHEGEGGQDG
jgi:hypothetical protein